MRRQDRVLPECDSLALLRDASHGVLSLQEPTGGGYGVPMNFAWDEAGHLYLHCAPAGHKLECLQREPRACFVITGTSRILPAQFSTAYESVLLHGEVRLVDEPEEKVRALRMLIQKLAPQEAERGEQYIHRAVNATAVLRFHIERICGKAHHA